MKKNKGFTLVELLVTIVIIGLLVTIGYIGSRAILERSSDTYYHNQENMLLLAGREYFADNRSELPKEVGNTASITLETLIDQKYIDPVKDTNEKDCNFKESTVVVQKVTETDYQYYVTLVCDNSNYQTKGDETDPIITFDPNKKSSQSSITVKMKVTDNEEIQSVRYVITKEGETYKDSGYQAYKGDINITLTELGLYDITGYAIDSFGNITSKKSGKYSIYKGIDCSNITFSNNNEDATNQDIGIKITVPNNTYRWELNRSINGGEYEQINSYIGNQSPNIILSKEGSQKLKVVVYDSDGNSCSAVSEEYKVDRTPPTLSIEMKKKNNSTNLTESSNINSLEDYTNDTWYSGYVVLKGSCSDGESKCSISYKVSGASENTDGYVTGTTRNINAEGISTITYKATDEAGNTTTETFTVKLDRTAPSLSVVLKKKANSTNLNDASSISSLTNYTNNTWYNGYVVLRGSCNDKLNSCTVSDSVTGAAGNTEGYIVETTRNINAEGTSTVTYRATDEAGNTASSSYTIKLDRTAPACPSISSNVAQKTWTNKNVTLTFGFTSDTTKWRWYTGSSSSSLKDQGERSTSTKTATISSEGQTTVKVRVYDSVGNYRDCFSSNQYYIDKTKPTCSVSFSGSANGNGWRKSNTTVTLSTSDNVSVSSKGLTTSTSATYNGTTSASQGNTSASGTTWRGYVKDAAGNTNSCSSKVYVDTTKPTIKSVKMTQDDHGKVYAIDYNGEYFANGETYSYTNFTYYLLNAGDSRKYYANASTTDVNSGVSTVQICNSDGSSCVNNGAGITVTGTQGTTTNKIVKVTDKAGNSATFPFKVKRYTQCQEWHVLNYCNALGRFADYPGVNAHVDGYFNYINTSDDSISSIHDRILEQGVAEGSKEYAMIGIYWDMYTSTFEARRLCGSTASQWGRECIVRHWYYTLLRREPDAEGLKNWVNHVGVEDFSKYFANNNYSSYSTLVSSFVSIARAEGAFNKVNSGNWTPSNCSLSGIGGLN